MNAEKPYSVRAVHCDYRATDEEVYQALKRATAPLERSWDKLRKARRIGIKFNHNQGRPNVHIHAGQRQSLVSDPVARATLRLLQEQTRAEIIVIELGVETPAPGDPPESCLTLLPMLREFNIPLVNGHTDPVVWISVPGGGQMFQRYPVLQSTRGVDALITVQKVKNHGFMGVTLGMKNLFGLVPLPPLGRPRGYYHHLVRMPYMLADLGRIHDPALTILDGIVCQAGEEWGVGDHPRICNTLIAGDQVVATDACCTHLMGHNPQADWLTAPFHRDRNALLVAAEAGFGTVDLKKIDFVSEVQAPIGAFFAKITDTLETVVSWRRTTAEQALYYYDHRQEIIDKHAGEYILLQMGEVRWADASGDLNTSRRILSGEHPECAMWFKYVDPEETEGERYNVYEETLKQMAKRS